MMTISRGRTLLVGGALLALMMGPRTALAQVDQSRRELSTPGLVLETGTRTSACDVLTFANNGQFLFATGDDKVVRTWKFTPKGLETIPDPPPAGSPQAVLRWTSHRERRGNIYAAAVSPDPKGQYIAIGGLGIRNSQFAVLDRFSGKIVNALPYISPDPKLGLASIWSVAFSPSGDQVACGTGVGSVWVWDWKTAKSPVLIGQHTNPPDVRFNYVRFLAYQKGQLVSADENGGVYRWSLAQATGSKIFDFTRVYKGMLLRSFAMSPDGNWLAAAMEANKVEIHALGGSATKTVELPSRHYPHAIAFDPSGKKLAVSIRIIPPDATFYKESGHRVGVFDVSSGQPKSLFEITPTYRIEALTFHPGGKVLATAGGKNHDVNVYDLSKPQRPLGPTMAGPGECIWGVSLSRDGRYLGFQTDRNPNPSHPNEGGAGPVRVFDLQRRLFARDAAKDWLPLRKSADGWQVKFASINAHRWSVEGPNTRVMEIKPWDDKITEFPRCYTFLPATAGHPTRIVVGHLYGASIYDLTPAGTRRTRILTGHESEVTAMALSADGKRLITASRDQTLAGWSLEDWPSHPSLGANIFLKGGRLWAGTVDQGSPFWEAGLSSGDELVFVVVEGKIVYNRGLVTPVGMTRKFPDSGTAPEALAALQKPDLAGTEIYLGWKRPGENTIREALSFLRDRPIWRLFPTKDGEWVMWRYQDFYYDTSTRGDSLIGWQRNTLDEKGGFNVKGTPEFYRAEQFRKSYHSPEKLNQTLQGWSRTAQGKSTFSEIEPPTIALLVDGLKGNTKVQVKDKPFNLAIKVTPHSERQNQELARVILWINDFQFKRWEGDSLQKNIVVEKNSAGLVRGIFEVPDVVVPPTMLRAGDNVLFVQCYNKADVRGESTRILATNLHPRPQANMYGLFIGVGDYKKSSPRQINLGAPQDAEVLAEVWKQNHGKLYAKAEMHILREKQVTPVSVAREFDGLANLVKPDDLLVFHLGGHGVATRKMLAEVKAAKFPKEQLAQFNQQVGGLGSFYFLCGNFDFLRIRDTTISLDDLYDKFVKLPCHKLIMLDACNSAAVDPSERKGTDIIRLFTKDGVGPIIFAACKAEESAIEFGGFVVQPASGLFAQAIVKTLEEDFTASKRGELDPGFLSASVKTNVGNWVNELRQDIANKDLSQNPQFFLPVLEKNFAILGR